jgi:hypothetical protein
MKISSSRCPQSTHCPVLRVFIAASRYSVALLVGLLEPENQQAPDR